jgi:DNA-binding MarR family transcriptional regulator
MEPRSSADQLDLEILEAMGELIAQLLGKAEQIARRYGVPAFCLKALHALRSPMAMRDLGRQMHCDPSFVTSVADMLEKRGLARREASTVDRRIKNLVLTAAGLGLRAQVEQELTAHVPWNCLDEDERRSLLAMIRKMTRAQDAAPQSAAPDATTPLAIGGQRAGEVSTTLITTQPSS